MSNLVSPDSQVEHIARHGVAPEEVEEVVFSRLRISFQAKSKGANPIFYFFGETKAGRYLFCVIIQFPDGTGYPVTSRPMTDREKQRYKKWRRR